MDPTLLQPKNSSVALVGAFEHYLLVQKQRAKNTVASYASDIRQFFAQLKRNDGTDVLPQAVSRSMANAYAVHLQRTGLSQGSVYRKLVALDQFWDFLIQKTVVQLNPFESIRKPRLRQALPTYIETKTVVELLDRYPKDTNERVRNQAMLELLFATGIRVSECTAINMSDVDFDAKQCRIFGKGSKERMVIFGERCWYWLNAYQTVRDQWKKDKIHALFISKSGRRLTPRYVQYIVRDANQFHSSPVQLTPHACRHTCASMLLTNGVGIRDVQALLGHASIGTTQRYASIPTDILTGRFLDAMNDSGESK